MSDRVLSRRPLTASERDQALFVEPLELGLVHRALALPVNVFVSGAAGAGKTTLLRRLEYDLDDAVHVSAEWFDTVGELIGGLAEAVAGEPLDLRGQGSERDVLEIGEALEVRAEHLGPVRVMLVDGVDADQLKTLFGRYRDVLWELPFTWVVSSRDAVPEPPADAFFDRVVELTAWTPEQVDELVARRAPEVGSHQLDRFLDVLRPTTPRQAIMAVQSFVLASDPDEFVRLIGLERRVVGGLPDRLHALYEALTDLGPTHAGDEQLLEVLGVSRSRVTHGLKELEQLELVVPQRNGRRVSYSTSFSQIKRLLNEEFTEGSVSALEASLLQAAELTESAGSR